MVKSCLVVIPVYNEGGILQRVVDNIKTWQLSYRKVKIEYLFVDDGSTDNSANILKINKMNYLSFKNNLGIGGAVQCGYLYAYMNDIDYVIQVDGDGQHPITEVEKLLIAAEKFDDELIIGSRFIEKSDYVPSIARKIGMIYSSVILKLFTGIKIYDTTSGFRLTKTRLIKFFSKDYPQHEAGLISLLIAAKRGFTFKEIPIKIDKRRIGASSINLRRSLFYPFKTIINVIAILVRK